MIGKIRGFWLAVLLCSFALLPLLRATGLPSGFDTLYHVYRVAEMQRSWQDGVFMPRWADAFYFGYGYPVFHYYASFTYYLTSILMLSLGITALNALKITLGISFLWAGLGMYLWAKDQWGQLGGLIAALVYVYSPYMLYTEPYTRGVYPELLAFAIAPWIFWRFDKLANHAATRRIFIAKIFSAAGLVALLIITHNLMSLTLFLILALHILWQTVVRALSWRQSLLMLLVAGCGVGLASYFWLPVVAERDAVQLDNLINVAELDYRNHFVTFDNLLARSPRSDDGAINGLLPRYNLGWGAILLATVGSGLLLGAMRRSKIARKNLFFLLLGILMIFLMTPDANRIWEEVSLLAFLQFPWRLLGPVMLCLAIIGGAVGGGIAQLPPPWRAMGRLLALFLPLIFALPLLYVTEWDLPQVDTSVAAYQQAEVAGLQRGTTFSGEYLPIDVVQLPPPNPRILAEHAAGGLVNKINLTSVPPDTQIEVIDQSPHFHLWRVESEAAFQMEVQIFYFPGWRAYINGSEVEITTVYPSGWMSIPVPAGASVVELRLTNTTPRNMGYALSLVSLFLLGGISVLGWRWNHVLPEITAVPQQDQASHKTLVVPALFTAALFASVLALNYREGVAWLDSPAGTTQAADTVTDYTLTLEEDTIRLIGYDISDTALSAGGRLEVVLYWYAPQPIERGFASFVHVSTGGPPQAQSDRLNPGGIPTKAWTPDGYIYDEHIITLPDWLPNGEYDITVGLWTCDGIPEGEPCGNGLRPTVMDADGDVLGDTLFLQHLQLR